MKSVLVIDKPQNCDECDICYYKDKELFCPFVGFLVERDYAEAIHDDCPLRDLPSYQVANNYDFECYTNGIAVGWNSCLEKITGEVPNYVKTKGHGTGAETKENTRTGGE